MYERTFVLKEYILWVWFEITFLFLFTAFMVATQFFFTICFIAFLVSLILIILYSTCYLPIQKNYVKLILSIGGVLLGGSICGCIGVIIFAVFGNTDGWMPGHLNNFLGWSFVVACIGSVVGIIAGILFLAEANIYNRKLHKSDRISIKFSSWISRRKYFGDNILKKCLPNLFCILVCRIRPL